MALGAEPDALNPALVAESRRRVAETLAEHARRQTEQDHAWVQAQRRAGVGRTLVLDPVDGTTPLATLVAQMPTDRCSAGPGTLSCGPSPTCQAEQTAAAQAQSDRQRELLSQRGEAQNNAQDPRWRFQVSGLSAELQLRLRQTEQALRRCNMRPKESSLLLAGEEVRQLALQALEGKVASMALQMAGNPQRVRNLLSQRLGAPQSQQVLRTEDTTVFVPGQQVYVPGVGTAMTQGRVETEPVVNSSTKYVWRQRNALVEEHLGTLKFSFVAAR